jgi:hypothetical protein
MHIVDQWWPQCKCGYRCSAYIEMISQVSAAATKEEENSAVVDKVSLYILNGY